jgi:hypothetical protein
VAVDLRFKGKVRALSQPSGVLLPSAAQSTPELGENRLARDRVQAAGNGARAVSGSTRSR